MRNQRAMREKKAPSGMAPLLPVCTSRMFSALMAASVMPGKYAAQRHATPGLARSGLGKQAAQRHAMPTVAGAGPKESTSEATLKTLPSAGWNH